MDAILLCTTLALRSLFARGMLGTIIYCVLATIVSLIIFALCAGIGFTWLGGHFHQAWISWLGSTGAIILAWFLFPGIMPIIVSFFDERIARVIETKDYPNALPGQPQEFIVELFHDTRFAVRAILLNILIIPLYLLPLFMPFGFYLLNGYLLGREFFVMAAKRHMPREEAEALRKKHARIVLAAGILLAVMATLPVVNLIAPFWGIALMVHLFHQLKPSQAALIAAN